MIFKLIIQGRISILPSKLKISKVIGIIILTALCLSCSTTRWHSRIYEPSQYKEIDTAAPFLKCHTKTGEVYVLSDWKIQEEQKLISGQGSFYDVNRNLVKQDTFTIFLDSLVLLETNQPEKVMHSQIGVMTVLTAASLALTIYCITNPKACFGSCPTFYAKDDTGGWALQAEGFSSSIAKILEEIDLDPLFTAHPKSKHFELQMRNEALETHAVNSVRLYAVPKSRPATRVFKNNSGNFYPITTTVSPNYSSSTDPAFLSNIQCYDGKEYFSPAGDKNLAEKEVIELEFPVLAGHTGLAIRARNSLLSTYLFYQGLAYMGKAAGEYMAGLEAGEETLRKKAGGIGQVLGGIEILVRKTKGNWQKIGTFKYTGPIAHEVLIFPLPLELQNDSLKVRLRLTKGHWRIDWVALAQLESPVKPLILEPQKVFKDSLEDHQALISILDTTSYLFTYPGDIYSLVFELPSAPESYELFLESSGYYYEWMRKEWLEEENPQMVMLLFGKPEKALKKLAPEYKKVESQLEEIFWQSRISR